MKKILFLATAFVFSLAAMAQLKADDVIKMNTEKYDFGKIKQNIPAIYYFEIKNTSDKPIVVENAWGSCGCTTPVVPKEPILPGATSKLKVQYSAASLATFEKVVYIKLAGIDQPKEVKITGEVLEPAAFDTYVKEKGKEKDKPSKSGGR
jgi:hypothetical protein